MSRTAGQEADDAAFEEFLDQWKAKIPVPPGIPDCFTPSIAFRQAFFAGMERGLEKRGCCEEGTDAKHSA